MLDVGVGELELTQDCRVGTDRPSAAIEGLYEQYYDRIVRYILVRIGDQNEAENLGGDVFLKALRSVGSFRGNREQMRAWLFKIAHNLVVDHLRKASKRRTVPIDEVVIRDKVDVAQAVETKMELERLTQALSKLTPAQREVIGLRFFAGVSSAEAGEILGKKAGAVREMQRAAVQELRRQMYP